MRTFTVLRHPRTISTANHWNEVLHTRQKSTHKNHFFAPPHCQNTNNGKVRPFDHEGTVRFSFCLFVHDTHLTLTLFPSQYGWLLHGKWSKKIMEASVHDFRRRQWSSRSSSSLSCPLLPSRSSPTMVSAIATLPKCLIVVCPSLTSSSSLSLSLAIRSSATVILLLRRPFLFFWYLLLTLDGFYLTQQIV